MKIEKIKAVSDNTRFTIMEMLVKQKNRVGIYIEEFQKKLKQKNLKVEPTLLSHHLSILRKQKMVKSEREGKKVKYSLVPSAFDKAGSLKLGGKTVLVF